MLQKHIAYKKYKEVSHVADLLVLFGGAVAKSRKC